jgi:hypothetical protein
MGLGPAFDFVVLMIGGNSPSPLAGEDSAAWSCKELSKAGRGGSPLSNFG